MHAIGAPVAMRRRLVIYTISAAFAGVAGALIAQTTQFVGLGLLGLERSGTVLIMLIIGGVGRLYGAFIGVPLYMIAQDRFLRDRPGLLVFLDRPVDGCWSWCSPAAACSASSTGCGDEHRGRDRAGARDPRACSKSFGALTRRQCDRLPPRARRSPCADRAERRRQDQLCRSGDRRVASRAPGESCSTAPTSPTCRKPRGSSAVSFAPFRSPRCSAV